MTGRLLIVIPTLNESAHIQSVIESLLAQAPAGTRLVVADGDSDDVTQIIISAMAAADPRIHLLQNPARFQSAGINLAVQKHGEGMTHLLRADAHASYPPDFIPELLADMQSSGADSVVVPMRTLGPTPFTAAVAAAQNSLLGTGGSAHRIGNGGRFVDHGHHALMRLAAFRAVGGYDPAQSHNEDAELDHRLTASGHTIWLTARTSVGYVPRRSFGALFRQYFRHGQGRATTAAKHRMRLKPRQMAPLLVPPALVAALVGLALAAAAPVWLVLALPAAIWAALCLGYGAVLALRARRPAILLAGPVAMTMHLGWGLGFLSRRFQ